MATLVVAAALDTATYLRLPLVGASEANPLVALLAGWAWWLPVAIKVAIAAAVALAVVHRLRYFLPVAMTGAAWWGFGALVNSLPVGR